MGVNYYDDHGLTDEFGRPLTGNRRWTPPPTPTPAPGQRWNQDSGPIWPTVVALVALAFLVATGISFLARHAIRGPAAPTCCECR